MVTCFPEQTVASKPRDAIIFATERRFASDGCIQRTTEGCIASVGCNSAQPWVALHPWVAIQHNPGLHCICGLHSEDNPGLLCIRGLQFEDKNDQVNNTDLSRTKRRICARRFPKGERKALWWGDGAKPHILKCCIHRLQFEDNRGLYCIRGLQFENNRGLNCIRRLQYSTTRGCFASVGCTSGI